ncbi:MAG: DUF5723 family protein [Bacteroidota bacterium]
MKFISKLVFLLFIQLSFVINAQQYLGIVGSNYAGTNSIYANPANSVDSRHKVFINLAAADLFIGNNAIKWNAPYSFLKLISGAVIPSQKLIWRNSYLTAIENNKEKNLNALVELRGPSVLYSIDSKQAVAFTSRGRGAISFTNVSPEIAKLMQYGPRNPTIIRSGQDLNMALNMNAFVELGISYAKDISLNPEEAIKIGISAKRIVGLTNFHMVAKDSDYQLVNDVVNPQDPSFLYDNVLNIQHIDVKYGQSDEEAGLNDFSLRPGSWIGKDSPGRGFGFDLGISFESRPEIRKYSYKVKGKQRWDETQNKYAYKIGLSIIDIGRVKFDNPSYVSNYYTVTDNKYVFDNQMRLLPISRLVNGINNSLNVGAASSLNSFYSSLPTAIQAYFDYKVKDNYYVYSTWVQNLRSDNKLGMRMPSLISVVPRYESKWINLAVPLSLLNDYQLLTLGFSARLGPFFIGSDNLGGLFNLGNPRGMDIYSGLNIPIFNKLPSISTDCYYEKSERRFQLFKRKPGKRNKGLGQV